MASTIDATYCLSGSGRVSLSLTSVGPDCTAWLDMSTRPFGLQCREAAGNVTCTNQLGCATGYYRDAFTLRKGDGRASIFDRVSIFSSGATFQFETVRSLTDPNATVVENSGTSTMSPAAPTSTSPSAGSSTRPIPGLKTLLLLPLLLVAIFAPSAQAHDPAIGRRSREPTKSEPLELVAARSTTNDEALLLSSFPQPDHVLGGREVQGAVARQLALAAMDVVQALGREGATPDAQAVVRELAATAQSLALPPALNIEISFAQGRVDDALKETMKLYVERALVMAILGGAVLAEGADLVLLLQVHVFTNLIVDSAYATLAAAKKSAQPTPSATGVPGSLRPIEGCNAANYSSSSLFGQTNPFGTVDWRDCTACCANWALAEYGGPCRCCMFQSQYDTNPDCCSPLYYSHCCQVSCGNSTDA